MREKARHAIEKKDDRGRHHTWLWQAVIREKVAAVNRVVEVFPG